MKTEHLPRDREPSPSLARPVGYAVATFACVLFAIAAQAVGIGWIVGVDHAGKLAAGDLARVEHEIGLGVSVLGSLAGVATFWLASRAVRSFKATVPMVAPPPPLVRELILGLMVLTALVRAFVAPSMALVFGGLAILQGYWLLTA
jgi:hypothetical protein